MHADELKNKFDRAVALLPEEMISLGKREQRADCIGLTWPGGSFFFGEYRGIGEFTLHVFEAEEGHEYYAHYPVYSNGGELEVEEIRALVFDLDKYKAKLTP